MSVAENIADLIGDTPHYLLQSAADDHEQDIYLKLEAYNPGSSVKDRIAFSMIRRAEREGFLAEDGVIVEPTSGNTGIGLAMIGTARGYRVILTMPDSMSQERRDLLRAFGAELILTSGDDGMPGAIDKARELVDKYDNYYMPNQFANPANPDIHRRTTAREILDDFGDDLDYFVAGVGTGGTITGVGQVLKEESPDTEIVAVEPAGSPVLSGGESGSHSIQGIGAGFIPEILERDILDRVVTVEDEEAEDATRLLAEREGLLCGVSSGAALAATFKLAAEVEPDSKILAIAPDYGERYLSLDIFGRTAE